MIRLKPEEVSELVRCIHRDFLSGELNREYIRNMFRELGLSETEIFGLMELLGVEKEK